MGVAPEEVSLNDSVTVFAGVLQTCLKDRSKEHGQAKTFLSGSPQGNPQYIAENYWAVYCQPRDSRTHEIDLRPWIEEF